MRLPPPMPCTARSMSISVKLRAVPEITEPVMKMVMEARNSRLRPMTLASHADIVTMIILAML
jgi:hypothetical protein